MVSGLACRWMVLNTTSYKHTVLHISCQRMKEMLQIVEKEDMNEGHCS